MVKARLVRSLVVAITASWLVPAASLVAADASSATEVGLDFSEKPLVIFAPSPPKPEAIADYPLPDGAVDYHDLFAAEAPWLEAAQHVDVFAIPSWFVRHYASDDELRTLIAGLEERDIALGLEMEPLTWPGPEVCDHTEGFEGPWDLEMAQKLKDLGGTVALVSLDEPYVNAHKLTGPGACGYPVEQVVDEVADFIRQLRLIHPDVLVGSIEPVLSDPYMTPRDMEIWLDTYQERTGEQFAFLDIDVDWRREDWPETVRAIEEVADSRGVPFGILYWGSEFEQTNDAWLRLAADHFVTYEQEWGGSPDVVGFYSWHEQPDRLLPDDDTDTFTGRINQYFGERSLLTGPWTDGKRRVAGSLSTLDGEHLAGQLLRATAEPLDGARQRHELSGTVPASARTALVAVRANVEGGDPSPVDVRISEVSYREGAARRNLVPNPRFAKGLESWSPYGAGSVKAARGRSGRSLLLRAKPKQAVLVDGEPFKVTPGADFTFAATIDVASKSLESGYVSVIFLGDAEVSRQNLWFTTRPIALPPTTTDDEGGYRFRTDGLRPGRYKLVVSYDGDIAHWPARSWTLLGGP